jgi:hypothetical protein
MLKKVMTNFSTEQFLQEYFDALTADSNVEYDFWQSLMNRNTVEIYTLTIKFQFQPPAGVYPG